MQFVHIYCVTQKRYACLNSIPSQNTKGIKMSLSGNVEVSIELNHNSCVYMGRQKGVTQE